MSHISASWWLITKIFRTTGSHFYTYQRRFCSIILNKVYLSDNRLVSIFFRWRWNRVAIMLIFKWTWYLNRKETHISTWKDFLNAITIDQCFSTGDLRTEAQFKLVIKLWLASRNNYYTTTNDLFRFYILLAIKQFVPNIRITFFPLSPSCNV